MFVAGELSKDHRLERDHLLAALDDQLFWRARAEAPLRNPDWYITRLDPEVYVSRADASAGQRMAAYINYARQIPAVATQIKANLRLPMPEGLIERGMTAFAAYARYYREVVPRAFAGVTDVRLQQQFTESIGAAIAAMLDLEDVDGSGAPIRGNGVRTGRAPAAGGSSPRTATSSGRR